MNALLLLDEYNISPTIDVFGLVEIRWYSLLILLGVIFAYTIIKNEGLRHRIKTDFLFNLMFWTIIFGILGARLYYVLFNLDYYLDNFSEIYKIWNGGLAIHGGIIAGLITMYVYCKKYKVNFRKVLDISAPAVLLAQGIGRWGNFFNAEAYGSVVEYKTLVNMKIIPQFVIDNMYINGNYHLPMFYFESLACVLGFLIILILRRRKYIKTSQITGFYLVWYGVVRFIIESFRTDSLMIANLKVAQLVSVIMFIVGIAVICVQAKKPKLDELYNTLEEDMHF